jgi:hypothetical protein
VVEEAVVNDTVTLIGGPGDGQRVPKEKPMWRPTGKIADTYPFEVLGPVDYTAQEIGYLWPVRVAHILDEELHELEHHHEVSRREHFAGDPFARYGMVLPEDAISYRIKFWTTWLRWRRILAQKEAVGMVFPFLLICETDHYLSEYKDEIHQVMREELRELVKLMVPSE